MARQTSCPLYPARSAVRAGWEIRVVELKEGLGTITVSYPTSNMREKDKKFPRIQSRANVLVVGDPYCITPSAKGEWKQEGMLALDNREHILLMFYILASSHGIPLPPFFCELMSEALGASPAMEQL